MLSSHAKSACWDGIRVAPAAPYTGVSSHMSIDRKQMEIGLKSQVVPTLRELGFKGSFPNLYRDVNNFVSLINFQFFSSGGSFCINLSYADPGRENIYHKKDTEAKKLKVMQAREQVRLGASNLIGDHWFSFGKTSYNEYRGEPIPLEQLTSEINQLISSQAEQWWSNKCSG